MNVSTLTHETKAVDRSPSDVWRVVPDDVVVTRGSDGQPRSWFRDDSWNIEAYGKNHPNRNIHFRNLAPDGADANVAFASQVQAKQVMFLLMHHASDAMPAPATLKTHMLVLKAFTVFATTRHQTLYQGFADVATILAFIRQEGAEAKAQRLHAVLVHLNRLGVSATGVDIPLRKLHAPSWNALVTVLTMSSIRSSPRAFINIFSRLVKSSWKWPKRRLVIWLSNSIISTTAKALAPSPRLNCWCYWTTLTWNSMG